jgi:23S rRNA (guanosine2251-2'-O)-methyltransferase
MAQLIVILDNLRSAANVGSILRTCDAAGVSRVIACGSTPYPRQPRDARDPVVVNRNAHQIAKTALGAELTVAVEYIPDSLHAATKVRAEGRTLYALEQAPGAVSAMSLRPTLPAALIVGNEVSGIGQSLLELCDAVIEIPQVGVKESLNVAVATGIALYQLLHRS